MIWNFLIGALIGAILCWEFRALNKRLKLMAAEIEQFSTDVNAAFDKLGTAIDGVTADVADLKSQIEALQNSSGLTPEDKAKLTAIQERANTLTSKLEALDALTVPPTPPETPV